MTDRHILDARLAGWLLALALAGCGEAVPSSGAPHNPAGCPSSAHDGQPCSLPNNTACTIPTCVPCPGSALYVVVDEGFLCTGGEWLDSTVRVDCEAAPARYRDSTCMTPSTGDVDGGVSEPDASTPDGG